MIDLANERLGNSASTLMCDIKEYTAEDTAKIPANARFEIETISIDDDDRCEVKFTAKERIQ